MKRMQRVFGDLDALRFVDGRLDEERLAAFQSHLADHPDDAARVATWVRQNDTIRAAFAGVALEPVPVALRLGRLVPPRSVAPVDRRAPVVPRRDDESGRGSPTVGADVAYLPPARRRAAGPAAYRMPLGALALFCIAALLVYIAHGLVPATAAGPSDRPADVDSLLMARAADAFDTYAVDPQRPVEYPAAQTASLASWLRQRIGLPVPAPNLGARGWRLLGGRLVPGTTGPGALFVYENEAGERLGLYAQRVPSDAPATTIVRIDDDTSAMSWANGPLAYVLTTRRSLDWMSRNGETLRDLVAAAS